MAHSKSTGTTASEQYLARLCERTFLSLWSYPNVFRDQGQKNGKGDGKELCDLLVIFGNDIIIFSDKSCAFPSSGDPNVDWSRWFRRSVLKSSEQVYGAERWIRQFPTRLYLDRGCTQRFPIPISDTRTARFHRVVVALNAGERCRNEVGGSGSLFLAPHIVGNAHVDAAHSDFAPFAVGQIDPNRGFIHIFDDISLDRVMQELDTVSDFVAYLTKKEECIVSGRLLLAPSEEDLLAVYLTHLDESGRHGFPAAAKLAIEQGSWSSLASNPRYIAKKEADRPSYAWDAIIEEFTKHTLGGTLVVGSEGSFDEMERVYRVMAAEGRHARRVLSNTLGEKVRNTKKGQIAARTLVSLDQKGTIYVFVCMANPTNDEGRYRAYRRDYLTDYCQVVSGEFRDCPRVVGIATEAGFGGGRSHDVIYLEPGEWTPGREAFVRQIQEERKFFTRTTRTHAHDEEYPEVRLIPVPVSRPSKRRKVGRNDPCPCGSGLKFKKCCLRFRE